ncbi:MAG: sulfatase-like hydrolase/transferase [Thermoguttaceae bacterium]|jgi:arylsulfatase A-like enzyme|nr:sulfatase-like hydrolase/transferase [Thermoguttaceae bacterium]
MSHPGLRASLFAFCLAVSPWLGTAGAEVARPNIVIVLADDLGWNDVGYHGSDIRTPHIDALAAGGARFEQHYVAPVCSPTRVGLLTGRNPAHFGVFGPLGATTLVRPADVRLPFALRELGYTTHIAGKWHIGELPEHRPLLHGFTTSYGYLRGQIDPYTHRYKFGDHVTWHRNDEFIDECGHVTDLITQEAVRVIEQAGEQPFFLYVCHHSPHYPLNEPPNWIDPYNDVFDDVWRRHFAAAVTHMDDAIGKVIEALDRTGKRKNTLVIFLSDNGGQESWSSSEREYNGRYAPHTTLGDNRPLRGWKGSLYEGGIRVPAAANWPGTIEPERVVGSPVSKLDWAPTLIRLAGGQVNPAWKLEGADIWPLLTGEAGPAQSRQFFWNHGNAVRALRDGDWKLILHRNGRVELFNLAIDPNEEHDLSEEDVQKVEQLRAELDRWQRETQPSD